MSNEQYLAVSYCVMAVLSAAVGSAVWARLRGPLERLVKAARHDLLPLIRKLFPLGLVLSAIAGFCSVSYPGCVSHTTYASIVADRSYLIARNQEQAREMLAYLKWAVIFWCAFALLALFRYGRDSARMGESHRTNRYEHPAE